MYCPVCTGLPVPEAALCVPGPERAAPVRGAGGRPVPGAEGGQGPAGDQRQAHGGCRCHCRLPLGGTGIGRTRNCVLSIFRIIIEHLLPLRELHGRRNFKDTNPLISSLVVIFVWGGEAIL
jgi:hypothetical protein